MKEEKNTHTKESENSKCFSFFVEQNFNHVGGFYCSFMYIIGSTMHRVVVRLKVALNNPYDKH